MELYCYRLRKYIGAYCAVLGGCDGIVFGGGVGEHVPEVRERASPGMEWAGIELDPAANRAARGAEAAIQSAGSRVRVHVIPVDEEAVMVRAAVAVMGRRAEVRASRPPLRARALATMAPEGGQARHEACRRRRRSLEPEPRGLRIICVNSTNFSTVNDSGAPL